MITRRWHRIALAVLCGWLLIGTAGCSRGYKTGSSITAADLAKALPEFPITLPPGGTNLYLERDSRPPLVEAWLKVAVPISTLTNFLRHKGRCNWQRIRGALLRGSAVCQ